MVRIVAPVASDAERRGDVGRVHCLFSSWEVRLHCFAFRRWFIPMLAALRRALPLVALAGGPLLGPSQSAATPPNVVVILVDDQGWTDLSTPMDPDIAGSASDYYQTPHLEALAAQGMRFSNAYAAAPVCSPTRAALQTGKSPAQLQMTSVVTAGVPNNPSFTADQRLWLTPPMPRSELPTSEITLAEHLRAFDAQYATAHFGKWHLNVPVPPAGSNHLQHGYEAGGAMPTSANDPKATRAISTAANQFMADSAAAGRPFFLQISYEADHIPVLATLPTITKYQNLPPGTTHSNYAYAAMNEELDAGVGSVLQQIADLGLADDTYVIYTSDNGGVRSASATINDPLFSGKWTLYEGGIRVPFIVRGPGIAAGSVSDVPIVTTDLFPTISALAGAVDSLPAGLEGADLSPVWFNGGDLPEGVAHLQRANGPEGELFFHFPHQQAPSSAIIDGQYKLIRFYGRPFPPETVLLFDLEASITESSDPRSLLNLASSMPELTAQLEAKLDAWLDAVDASLPYDVALPAAMTWNAAFPGNSESGWRSTTDVDSVFRETWQATAGAPLQVEAAPAHQPWLPQQAVRFEGSDSLQRQYFHVSTPGSDLRDSNHSATFEFWVRWDDLAAPQVLLETGDGKAGLSLSVGDADGSGGANDLRFRALAAQGDALTITAQLDKFADPTADFVHVVGVVRDAPDRPALELYLNGLQVGAVDLPAPTGVTFDWDGYDWAGLGGAAGGLGAAGGAGPQPFTGAMRGDVALFKFANFAVSAQEVLANYNARLPAVDSGIDSVSGAVDVAAARPASVGVEQFVTGSSIVAMLERRDVLDDPLVVDLLAENDAGCCGTPDALPSGGTLAGGESIASYLLHFDPPGTLDAPLLATGSITFAQPILGILFETDSLQATDALLGTIGAYPLGTRGVDLATGDQLRLSADRRTLELALLAAADEIVQLRVLTASASDAYASADFNGDGRVDDLDLTAPTVGWFDRFGDDLGGADLLRWQRSVGFSSNAAFAAIPEPAGCGLAMGGLLLAAASRSRKRTACRRFS